MEGRFIRDSRTFVVGFRRGFCSIMGGCLVKIMFKKTYQDGLCELD